MTSHLFTTVVFASIYSANSPPENFIFFHSILEGMIESEIKMYIHIFYMPDMSKIQTNNAEGG